VHYRKKVGESAKIPRFDSHPDWKRRAVVGGGLNNPVDSGALFSVFRLEEPLVVPSDAVSDLDRAFRVKKPGVPVSPRIPLSQRVCNINAKRHLDPLNYIAHKNAKALVENVKLHRMMEFSSRPKGFEDGGLGTPVRQRDGLSLAKRKPIGFKAVVSNAL
jgi:hypothetical protein